MRLSAPERVLIFLTALFLASLSYFHFSPSKEPHVVAETGTSRAVPYLVNINTATADELCTLQGIGPKLSERIVQYRNENGRFGDVRELINVSGIGEGKLSLILDYIKT